MRWLSTLVLLPALLAAFSAIAQESIGLSVPISGRFEPIAKQTEIGAYMALNAANQAADTQLALVLADDGCSAASAREAAEKFKQEKITIVVGPVCFEAAEALSRALEANGDEAVIVLANGLRDKRVDALHTEARLPLYTIAPDESAEADAIEKLVFSRWKDKPFAIVDDGGIYGRNLSDRLIDKLARTGRKPLIAASYRPLRQSQRALVRRLVNAGAEAIFVAGQAEDAAIISRDAASFVRNIEVATGESAAIIPYLEEAPGIPAGLLVVKQLDVPALPAAQALTAELAKQGVPPDPALYYGYAMIQIAAEARAAELTQLQGRKFDTVLGEIEFSSSGRASPVPHALFRWNGETLAAAGGQ